MEQSNKIHYSNFFVKELGAFKMTLSPEYDSGVVDMDTLYQLRSYARRPLTGKDMFSMGGDFEKF